MLLVVFGWLFDIEWFVLMLIDGKCFVCVICMCVLVVLMVVVVVSIDGVCLMLLLVWLRLLMKLIVLLRGVMCCGWVLISLVSFVVVMLKCVLVFSIFVCVCRIVSLIRLWFDEIDSLVCI